MGRATCLSKIQFIINIFQIFMNINVILVNENFFGYLWRNKSGITRGIVNWNKTKTSEGFRGLFTQTLRDLSKHFNQINLLSGFSEHYRVIVAQELCIPNKTNNKIFLFMAQISNYITNKICRLEFEDHCRAYYSWFLSSFSFMFI